MPEHCLTMRCIDCESHAIVHGKLDCNYMNRLGLSQPTVKKFMEDQETPEMLEAKIKAERKRIKEAQTTLDTLKKLKEEHGGGK